MLLLKFNAIFVVMKLALPALCSVRIISCISTFNFRAGKSVYRLLRLSRGARVKGL